MSLTCEHGMYGRCHSCDDIRRGALEARITELERELDAKHAKLVEVADKLRAERTAIDQARALICELRDRTHVPAIRSQCTTWLSAHPAPVTPAATFVATPDHQGYWTKLTTEQEPAKAFVGIGGDVFGEATATPAATGAEWPTSLADEQLAVSERLDRAEKEQGT